MGINLKTYFLYKLSSKDFVLLRSSRPGYNNANQNQENKAEEILAAKKTLMLQKYLAIKQLGVKSEFIGGFQGLPEGDILYEKKGGLDQRNLWYANSKYVKHRIFLSIAQNENEFWKITMEEDFADNGMTKDDLIAPAYLIQKFDFMTENDFDLSSIPDAYTFDLENKRRRENI